MPRYRLLVEYDGRPYCGFQAQAELPSVQASLERAVQAFSGERVRIHAAGRTDTGVHALGQVVHVDLEKPWSPAVVRDAMNAHLGGEPIAVLSADEVSGDWHARFSATGRSYLFRILNRRSPAALDQGRAWWVKQPLDARAMHAAAQVMLGQHDFTTFRDVRCQAKSPVKTLDQVSVERDGEAVILRFAARSFLHRQVRSMTGSLVEVGTGRWSDDDFKAALEARQRSACGPVAPPDGLYLTEVIYPANAAK
ncbi:MAG: tRNA pseudouridine(38-40) synthase TruA [Phenylobacterium sp.]|uniref:tRNA pseudouridine(38-40) synthase TruA n=1 Tax=Phenylobacterium sp. TaxID=1871053 RepID=UPI002733FAA9|nr:tRNA pseudouridine(38-40) synthase TruA [Phenylobacterium sp.]MDP3172924.1 tRNA pseudouridine(38-40) synthase TruA [Phenylobacterium sp.]